LNIEWIVVGKSVTGSTHKLRYKEANQDEANQDAIKWSPNSDTIIVDQSIIVAISDGHGSSRHFRSKKGAEIAVSVAIWIFQKFFEQEITNSNISSIKSMVYDSLPKIISRKWEDQVHEDIKKNPFTKSEKEKLVDKDLGLEAYGTTLLIVAIKDSLIFFIQIGDGDILLVDTAGNIQSPIEADKNILVNETSSLCMNNNWKEFRIKIHQFTKNSLPSLILLSTDGYSNSFGDNKKFQSIGRDYLKRITDTFSTDYPNSDHRSTMPYNNNENILGKKREFSKEIEKILEETTEKGSGDDITLGIIINLNSLSSNDNIFKKSKNGIIKLKGILAEGNDKKKIKQINEIIKDYFDPILKINRDLPDVWYNKGIALFNLSRYEEALECYTKALDLDPHSIDFLNNIGICYEKLESYSKALEYYTKALDLDSNYIYSLENKSRIEKKINHKI
jgi:serine/threonine protein phosphatase PrpC